MKDKLVDLLFEEYKQDCLFSELEKKGIDLTNITVQIYDIVFKVNKFELITALFLGKPTIAIVENS